MMHFNGLISALNIVLESNVLFLLLFSYQKYSFICIIKKIFDNVYVYELDFHSQGKEFPGAIWSI